MTVLTPDRRRRITSVCSWRWPPIGDRPLAVLRGGFIMDGEIVLNVLCWYDPRAPVGRS
jgi:hypothetical protein